MKIEIKSIKLSDIKLNPDNPRRINEKQMERLVKSLQEFPDMMDIREIVVDETMMILGGNMRYLALKKSGAKECIAKIVTDLTAEQKREFIIKDNSNFGEYDFDVLANSWDDLPLVDWGVDLPEDWLKTEPGEPADADPQIDKAEELNKVWRVKTGDLWQIGEHWLLCGDSTKAEDVARVMGGEKAELLFTSPPYADMRDYNGGDLSVDNLIKFIPAFCDYVKYQVVNLGIQRKDGEVIQYWDNYIKAARDCGYKLASWNVWNREQATGIGLQTAFFPIFHEWIFVFGFNVKEINRTLPKSEGSYERQKYSKPGTRRNKKGELKVSSKGDMSFDLVKMGTVTTVKAANTIGDSAHPAMFPVELPSEYIKAMTSDTDCVADPFLGSGTTMVACQNLNRKCRGIEISENYCAVVLQRMKDAFPDIEIKKING